MPGEKSQEIQIHNLRDGLRFYLVDSKTPVGKGIDFFIITMNLLICFLYVIETYPVSETIETILWRIELVIVFLFVIEYLIRLYAAPRRLKQLGDIYSIIDLIAILPTLSLLFLPLIGVSVNIDFMKLLRSLRVFRIFRFLRFTADVHFFFGSVTQPLLRVFRLILTILSIFFIYSGLFFQVEQHINPNVNNFGDAFYFSVVSLTTVGFGDITPLSEGGKWVTVFMILTGIVLIPWQISLIVKEWVLIGGKKEIICTECGLRFHDKDASHCKHCGHVIYQETDGL